MLEEIRERENSDPCYDLFEDWELIVSSFLSQYGLRLSTKEFQTVNWDEFRSLLAGISPDTVLGRVVAIRGETDKEIIKHFTRDQKRIYDDWKKWQADNFNEEDFNKDMENLEKEFAMLFG